jgi:hypothetical protein
MKNCCVLDYPVYGFLTFFALIFLVHFAFTDTFINLKKKSQLTGRPSRVSWLSTTALIGICLQTEDMNDYDVIKFGAKFKTGK